MASNKKQIISNKIDILNKIDYSVLEDVHGFAYEGAVGGFKASVDKINAKFSMQLLLGIFAGLILGLGYTAWIYSVKAIPSNLAWINTLLIGIIFPGCIIIITFVGGGLFTSHVFSTMPMIKGVVSKNQYFMGIGTILLGNFLGTGFMVAILALSGAFAGGNESFVTHALDAGMHKMPKVGVVNSAYDLKLTGTTIIECIVFSFGSGILCNILVSATLPITNSTKNVIAAVVVIIFAIAFFVLSGYQHSPANTYFFWIFIFEGFFEKAQSGITSNVSWFGVAFIFLLLNIIPAALGNWVGGGLITGGFVYLLTKKYSEILFKKLQLEKLKLQYSKL